MWLSLELETFSIGDHQLIILGQPYLFVTVIDLLAQLEP